MILYIGDEMIDLYPNALLFYTVQRVNIGSLTARSVSYSNAFDAPWTENNERLFGFAGHEQSRTVLPYRLRACKLVQSGVEASQDQVLQITKSSDKKFSLTLFENILEWFEAVNNKTLTDIEPIASSSWFPADMDSERLNTEGIISAFIFWAEGITFNNLNFLPSFYYHTIIKSILEYTGLSISGGILTDARFTDLIVPFAGNFEYPESYYSQFDFYNPRNSPQVVASVTTAGTVLFGQNVSNYVHGKFFARVSVGGITWNTGTYLLIQLEVNSTPVAQVYMASDPASGDSTEMEYEGFFAPGDVVNFILISDVAASGPSLTIVGSFGSSYMTFKADGVINRNEVNWNQLFPSDYKGADFLKDFFNRFAIIPKQVDNTLVLKTLEEIIKDVGGAVDWSGKLVNVRYKGIDFKTTYAQENTFNYTDRVEDSLLGAGSIDIDNTTLPTSKGMYTSIFGNTKTIKRESISAGYIPVFNEERVTEYEGFEPGRTVTGADDIDQTDENTIVELNSVTPFNFTIDALTVNTRVMLQNVRAGAVTLIEGAGVVLAGGPFVIEEGYYAILVYNNTNVPDVYIFPTEDLMITEEDPGLRLLTVRDATALELGITFDSVYRTDYKIGYFVDAAQDKDTGWQYFIDQFYPSLTEALQRNKVITKYYYLSEKDVADIDPHLMMYDGEGYYLINKVVNFYPGRITKCELFKVM